ncbi:chemotaxis protein methyltransferase [Sphingomonas metalli]|uniref:Chemotaxis protein methyltransferase n=1 Tax=Sphingomonas metalli TaxID=1779358 RepID=A0A916T7M9_9SPHN|nr:protein-glutamate O-methyltransferase CheR [Sphingomonas metalli]GGB34815.1 chemotaxis protein methyltransferase [Sphingomonas metalli]
MSVRTTAPCRPDASPAPACSANALAVLSTLLEVRTGQQLASYRSWRLDTALKPLLRARGLETLDQLVVQLLDGQDKTIGDRIVDALVNGETSFFRDQPVFDLIAEGLSGVERRRGRTRIWCAGCATGQEPLSLAMMFAERAESSGETPPDIVATDISEASLARARAARYNQFEIQRGLPIRRMMRWFTADEADWVAQPQLLRMIQYRRLNLVAEGPPAGRFDAILCRNVLLYLSPATKAQVFARLASALAPGGLLVLGAGETVIGQTGLFEPSKTLRGLYVRTGA